MTAAVAPGLAVSRACDSTDALPGLRPPDRVDGVAGTFGGVEGRRAAGAAPGGGGAAAAEPQAEAGLGGPDGDRRPGAAAPETVADEPAGDAGPAAAVAPAAGPLAVDLSPPGRTPAVDAQVAVLIEQMARENRAGATSGSRACCSVSATGSVRLRCGGC